MEDDQHRGPMKIDLYGIRESRGTLIGAWTFSVDLVRDRGRLIDVIRQTTETTALYLDEGCTVTLEPRKTIVVMNGGFMKVAYFPLGGEIRGPLVYNTVSASPSDMPRLSGTDELLIFVLTGLFGIFTFALVNSLLEPAVCVAFIALSALWLARKADLIAAFAGHEPTLDRYFKMRAEPVTHVILPVGWRAFLKRQARGFDLDET